MRHLIGIVLGIVLAAAVFFAGTWGYVRLAARAASLARLPGGGAPLVSDHGALAALAAVAGTGLLAGILIAVPRISPLGAGLPGLALLGWTALYVVSVQRAVSLIPLRSHAFGAGFTALLSGGILAAAGLMMVIPLFVPSRWQGRRNTAEADEAGEATVTDDSEVITGLAVTSRLRSRTELDDDMDDEPEVAGRPRSAGRSPAPVHRDPPPSGHRAPGITY